MKTYLILALAACSLASMQAVTSIPDCSLDCLTTVCQTATNITCLCTNAEATVKLSTCAYSACNITELLRLKNYKANTCGVPKDNSHYNLQLRVHFVMPFLTIIFLAGRIASRLLLDSVKADDYMMIGAEVFYMVDVGTGLPMSFYGFGKHTYLLTIEEITKSLQFFYLSELFYLFTVTLTKLSLLLFFRRVFPNKGFLQVIWVVFAFIIATNFSLLIALTFQCVPFYGNWTNWMYKVAPVKCINAFAVILVVGGMSIAHDVIILVMPLPILCGLRLRWQKKANILLMFSVGTFVIICGFIRFPALLKLHHSSDPSYDQAPIAIWTHFEQSIGIICGCLPACRSLLGYVFHAVHLNLQSTGEGPSSYQLSHPKQPKPSLGNDHQQRCFFEMDDRSERGGTVSIASHESQILFGEMLVPPKGKNKGQSTYIEL